MLRTGPLNLGTGPLDLGTAALVLDLLLFHLPHSFFGQLLAEEPFNNILLSSSPIADHDHHTARDVTGERTAKNNRRQSKWALFGVLHTPGTGAKSHLEYRMTVKNDDNGNEQAKRECVVGHGFVWLIESVRLRELILVMH